MHEDDIDGAVNMSNCHLAVKYDKAKVAAEDITRQHSKAQVTIQKIDLASLKSVRNCAQNLLDTEDKIDFLVNNAGNNFF
jgi:short-subunit dehydrogenase